MSNTNRNTSKKYIIKVGDVDHCSHALAVLSKGSPTIKVGVQLLTHAKKHEEEFINKGPVRITKISGKPYLLTGYNALAKAIEEGKETVEAHIVSFKQLERAAIGPKPISGEQLESAAEKLKARFSSRQ